MAIAAPTSEPAAQRFERHVVDGNLAVVFMGRYGLTYQFLPLRHHALVATAYRQMPGLIEPEAINGRLLGTGAELGWRLYTGSSGPTGFYFGLSGLAAYHTSDRTPWFATFGGAAEVGIAALVKASCHIAIGGGVQLTKADVDNDSLTDVARWFVGSGVAPRFTMALGHTLGR